MHKRCRGGQAAQIIYNAEGVLVVLQVIYLFCRAGELLCSAMGVGL